MSAGETLLPEGEYAGKVRRAHKDVLKDGREVLFLELEVVGPGGVVHTVHDVIQTQERLDQFLSSFGFGPGSMTLKPGEAERFDT